MTRAFSLKLEVCSRVPRTGMDEAIQAGAIRILKGSFVLYVGEPPEKIVTCGSHPLESSFHTVLGRGHMGSHIYGFIAVVAHTYGSSVMAGQPKGNNNSSELIASFEQKGISVRDMDVYLYCSSNLQQKNNPCSF
nr:hypothetical protein [Tanacetum cinerariifolium]